MARPKFLYVIDDEFHAHSDNTGALTLQQADLIGGSGPDSMIHIDRENAAKLRDALDDWLKQPVEIKVNPLTEAQQMMIRSARLSPPAAWIVSATGGRTGHERNAWKQNCQRLIQRGLLYANAHGDYTLTAEAETLRTKLVEERNANA